MYILYLPIEYVYIYIILLKMWDGIFFLTFFNFLWGYNTVLF